MPGSGQQTRRQLQRPLSGSRSLEDVVAESIRAARRRLIGLQREDGHWCAELEGDSILESEYALLLRFLGGREAKIRKLAQHLRQKQVEEGGWAIYPGGTAEVSASVKAYLVLKMVGDEPHAPHMVRAQRAIRRLGGLDACNSFTKLYLPIFGQYEWARSPGVPPEILLFYGPTEGYIDKTWALNDLELID